MNVVRAGYMLFYLAVSVLLLSGLITTTTSFLLIGSWMLSDVLVTLLENLVASRKPKVVLVSKPKKTRKPREKKVIIEHRSEKPSTPRPASGIRRRAIEVS